MTRVRVPHVQLPVLSALINKIGTLTKSRFSDVLYRFDVNLNPSRGHFGLSKDPVVVEAWAHLVVNGGVSVTAMYEGWFEIDISGMNASMTATQYLVPSLFGYTPLEWESWAGPYHNAKTPHNVYRAHRICARYNIDPITPAEHLEYLKALYIRPESVVSWTIPIMAMTKWIQTASKLSAAGYDRSQIKGFGSWVEDGWTGDAIVRLGTAGIELADAQRLWFEGLQDSQLIHQHLIDGLPFDWALGIHEQREGTK